MCIDRWLFPLALGLLPGLLAGQAPEPRGVVLAVPQDVRVQEGFDAAHSAGLFVGVRDFEDADFAEVPYAVDDAIDLAYLLPFS